MKLAEAQAVIKGVPKSTGYRVSFNHVDGYMLRGDFFPDRDEALIPTELHAWDLARRFAEKTVGKCVDIYVIDAEFRPVANYKSKEIDNRR